MDGASLGAKLSVGAVIGLHMGPCISLASISGTWPCDGNTVQLSEINQSTKKFNYSKRSKVENLLSLSSVSITSK